MDIRRLIQSGIVWMYEDIGMIYKIILSSTKILIDEKNWDCHSRNYVRGSAAEA
jgi:hypothetical protein